MNKATKIDVDKFVEKKTPKFVPKMSQNLSQKCPKIINFQINIIYGNNNNNNIQEVDFIKHEEPPNEQSGIKNDIKELIINALDLN